MKFEHTVRRPTDDHKLLVASEEKFLDKMGNDGWELCCVLDINSKRRAYYFKRIINNISEEDETTEVINGIIDIIDKPYKDDAINLARFVGWAQVAKNIKNKKQ